MESLRSPHSWALGIYQNKRTSNMCQLHVKNHYVPKSYLKRWTNTHSKVYTYRVLVEHAKVPIWKSHSVSAIAYHRHLYTQLISGYESDRLENWLDREFESPANQVLDRAISEGKLKSGDWEVLIKFLAAQDVRTPARLFEHLQRGEKILSETLQEVLTNLPEKLEKIDHSEFISKADSANLQPFPLKISTQFEDGADTGILKVESYVGRSTWIHSIRRLLENTSNILHSHRWSIVKPAIGYYWPTSDNPVVRLNYSSLGKYDLKGGWNVTKGNIFFPIGPEHAMFVQIGERPVQKNKRLPIQKTKELIKIVVENAHRIIFCNSENQDLPKLRKRLVDAKKYKAEAKEFRLWHHKNARLEREYISSNQNT
jgi:hypothetical protein